MGAWRVELYRTEGGRVPFRKAIEALGPEASARLVAAVDALEEQGLDLGEPLVKEMAGYAPLRELRVRHRRDQWRLLFFPAGGRLLVAVEFCARKELRARVLRNARDRMRTWQSRGRAR